MVLAAAVMAVLSSSVSAQDIERVKASGEQWSGEGSDWSGWYSLSTDPPPPGYVIASTEFVLVGDRRCGAWAECREIARSPTSSTWQFRMQGHDEQLEFRSFYIQYSDVQGQFRLSDPKTWPSIQVHLAGKKATSTGVLRVTYRPESASRPKTLQWQKDRTEWSGRGSDYSPWCQLQSEPTPAGYALADVQFELTGDRRCGAWAECREVSRTADSVTWEFRMQGHSETFGGGQRQSTGTLKTSYRLLSPPPITSTAPTQFTPRPRGDFAYSYVAGGNTRMNWRRTKTGWIEDAAAGSKFAPITFRETSREVVEGNSGTVVRAGDREMDVFIPVPAEKAVLVGTVDVAATTTYASQRSWPCSSRSC